MGRAIAYSVEELAWIKEHKSWPHKEACVKFCQLFNRDDVSPDNYKSLCHRKGWLTGRTGRYDKGSVPANKGKKMPFNANSARTQFKKGNIPASAKHLGHERITHDGYVMISIRKTNIHTGFERSYVLKHRWLWEKKHGPLGPDTCLKCLDGNRQNCDPSNWEAIPRAMLPRLSGPFGRGFDYAEPELKPAILAVTKLEYLARNSKDKS